MKIIKSFLLLLSVTLLLASCGIYSFTGASIPPGAKTVSVQYFPNKAATIQPNLSQVFTEKLKDAHFQDIWLNTLNPFNVKPESKKYDFFCTNQQKKKAINFLLQFQNKIIIGINLEGAVKGKRITPNKLKVICRGLYQANKDVQIILLSSPKTYENVIRLSKNMGLPYVFSSYKTESILDVAALIQNLQLIITPDTSIVHIASAFNVPIVSIHENNNDSYRLFAPKSQYSKTVFSQSVKGIDGYSINELIRYSDELISRVN